MNIRTSVFDCRTPSCPSSVEPGVDYCPACLLRLEDSKHEYEEAWQEYEKTTERDPNGLSPHSPGAKLDEGKIRPSLIFDQMPRALQEVARVGAYGVKKYTEGGWQHVPDGIARYTDAMDRHRLKESIEGPLDLDSLKDNVQLLHAAQVAWNALARLELMLRSQNTQ